MGLQNERANLQVVPSGVRCSRCQRVLGGDELVDTLKTFMEHFGDIDRDADDASWRSCTGFLCLEDDFSDAVQLLRQIGVSEGGNVPLTHKEKMDKPLVHHLPDDHANRHWWLSGDHWT